MDEAPKITSSDQIDRDAARRAYEGVSMDPERRGDQDREDYAATVNGLYAELWPLAATDEQRVILDAEMHRFRDGYHRRVTAFHASYSRVVSTMIAGPPNFPVRQMQKRGDAAHNRLNELIDYRKKAAEAVRRKVLAARPAEAVDAEAWSRLQRDVRRSLATIAGIDDGSERGYDRSAFTNSIAGKVERLAKAGEVRLVERAVELVQVWQEGRGGLSPRSRRGTRSGRSPLWPGSSPPSRPTGRPASPRRWGRSRACGSSRIRSSTASRSCSTGSPRPTCGRG
ncbi:hypothetical protein [Paludisphaera soli]|uniref:hypothetical protein n=1 Tax=Paludisphaera soli TaxID=2712865 RepID=UPI0013EA513D|nr:hypothetical protein [Paludisphaera soli]